MAKMCGKTFSHDWVGSLEEFHSRWWLQTAVMGGGGQEVEESWGGGGGGGEGGLTTCSWKMCTTGIGSHLCANSNTWMESFCKWVKKTLCAIGKAWMESFRKWENPSSVDRLLMSSSYRGKCAPCCLYWTRIMCAGLENRVYQPTWFKKEVDPITGNMLHVFTGKYWEHKAKSQWDICPDIYLWSPLQASSFPFSPQCWRLHSSMHDRHDEGCAYSMVSATALLLGRLP